MEIKYVPRSEWGAKEATEVWIDARITDPSYMKKEIHVHHSAAVDSEDNEITPNRWSYANAVAYMKRLEYVRPDLGPLPYSENVAVSEDLETVWVFEGRGLTERGAHTAYHNIPGIGWGILGNFNKPDQLAADAAVMAIEHRVAQLRRGVFLNLGDTKSPTGANAWGHRDSKATSCPGADVYRLLADFDLEGGLMSFTAHEIEELKKLVSSLDSVSSNGGFAEYAVNLIRKERAMPLHMPVVAENCDNCIKRGDTIVV